MITAKRCVDCGVVGVELSSLGRCLGCISNASDAWTEKIERERAESERFERIGRRCQNLFGTGEWVHGSPHTPGCVQHVAPAVPTGAPVGVVGSPENRLTGLAQAVMNAGEGQRNHMLNWASYKAAEMVASGELPRELVAEALVVAGLTAGLTSGEVGTGTGRGTVASGLRSGGAG